MKHAGRGKLDLPTEHLAIGGLILLALALRLYRLDWALPHTYEEATPLRIAWQMWGWDRGRDVNLDPEFFNYPSLTFYIHFLVQGLLYLVMKVAGEIKTLTDWQVMRLVDPTPLFLAARFVNVLFGVGTACVVFKTARLLGGIRAGLFSLALIALNSFHVARSQMVDVDIPLTFFAAFALHRAALISIEGRTRDYVLAGIAAGLASSCKYTGFLLVAPIALACLLFMRSQVRSMKAASRRIVIAIALAFVTFAITSPYVIIDAREFIKDFAAEREHMATGHFGLDEHATGLFYARMLFGGVMSVTALLGAAIGVGLFVVRQRRRPAIVMASFVVLYLIVISTWEMKADRYLLPLIPIILVFSGLGMAAALGKQGGSSARRRVAAIAFLLLVSIPETTRYVRHVQEFQSDARTDATAWLSQYVPAGSYVVTEYYGPEMLGPPVLMTLDPGLRKAVVGRLGTTRIFAMQTLPMFQTHPERSAPFYSLERYPNADYIIMSSVVAGRYQRDPQRFDPQIQFYNELARQMEAVKEFPPPRPGGVRLTVYRRRSWERPFAVRSSSVPPPPPISRGVADVEAEANFYYALGANCEFFGKVAEASLSYRFALQNGTNDARLFHNCVLGETRCLLAAGRTEDAILFLRELSAQVPDKTTRATLVSMANQLSESLRRRTPR